MELLASGRLSGQSLKFLKKLIKEDSSITLENKLIEHFKNYNIDYPSSQKYVNKYRQRTFRSKNKIIGKKQLNFYIDEDLYNRLQLVKNDLNMSYSELLEYLIKKV